MMVETLTMNEAGGIYKMAYEPHRTKSKGTGIGQKRKEDAVRKPMRRGKRLRFQSKKRRKEGGLYAKIKLLVIQETAEATGEHRYRLGRLDLDHIHGRHEVGFPLSAMFDPRNLQLLTRKQHREKTSAKTLAGQRMDYRTQGVQERLIAVALRIEKKLGDVWNNDDLRRAVESELYSE